MESKRISPTVYNIVVPVYCIGCLGHRLLSDNSDLYAKFLTCFSCSIIEVMIHTRCRDQHSLVVVVVELPQAPEDDPQKR